jgi:26S proteasome regulatory subunit N3
MGEIPDRATFNAADTAAALRPYLALVAAVRLGDLRAFSSAVSAHAATFLRDRTLTLIRRLDANVIKTGLRKLAASYSRISFRDIATKLQLGSPEDAEFLCAKVR